MRNSAEYTWSAVVSFRLGPLPMLEERAAALRELGRHGFEGLVQPTAAGTARALAERLPSYRDAPTYGGRQVPLLKRHDIRYDLHGDFGPLLERTNRLVAERGWDGVIMAAAPLEVMNPGVGQRLNEGVSVPVTTALNACSSALKASRKASFASGGPTDTRKQCCRSRADETLRINTPRRKSAACRSLAGIRCCSNKRKFAPEACTRRPSRRSAAAMRSRSRITSETRSATSCGRFNSSRATNAVTALRL